MTKRIKLEVWVDLDDEFAHLQSFHNKVSAAQQVNALLRSAFPDRAITVGTTSEAKEVRTTSNSKDREPQPRYGRHKANAVTTVIPETTKETKTT